MPNIFQDPTKALPKKDEQIVRIDFEKADLVGKPPNASKSGRLAISHVPNAGSKH